MNQWKHRLTSKITNESIQSSMKSPMFITSAIGTSVPETLQRDSLKHYYESNSREMYGLLNLFYKHWWQNTCIAERTALCCWRSMRRLMVLRPRMHSQQSKGPSPPPIEFCKKYTSFASSGSFTWASSTTLLLTQWCEEGCCSFAEMSTLSISYSLCGC